MIKQILTVKPLSKFVVQQIVAYDWRVDPRYTQTSTSLFYLQRTATTKEVKHLLFSRVLNGMAVVWFYSYQEPL